MGTAFTKHTIQCFQILTCQMLWHKGLNRTGKTAAMDTEGTFLPQYFLT